MFESEKVQEKNGAVCGFKGSVEYIRFLKDGNVKDAILHMEDLALERGVLVKTEDFTKLIECFAEAGFVHACETIIKDMKLRGINPGWDCYSQLVVAHAAGKDYTGAWKQVEKIARLADDEHPPMLSIPARTALATPFYLSKDPAGALHLVRRLKALGFGVYNSTFISLVVAFGLHQDRNSAMHVYEHIVDTELANVEKMPPAMFSSLMSVFANTADFESCLTVFEDMIANESQPFMKEFMLLVEACSKAGRLELMSDMVDLVYVHPPQDPMNIAHLWAKVIEVLRTNGRPAEALVFSERAQAVSSPRFPLSLSFYERTFATLTNLVETRKDIIDVADTLLQKMEEDPDVEVSTFALGGIISICTSIVPGARFDLDKAFKIYDMAGRRGLHMEHVQCFLLMRGCHHAKDQGRAKTLLTDMLKRHVPISPLCAHMYVRTFIADKEAMDAARNEILALGIDLDHATKTVMYQGFKQETLNKTPEIPKFRRSDKRPTHRPTRRVQ